MTSGDIVSQTHLRYFNVSSLEFK